MDGDPQDAEPGGPGPDFFERADQFLAVANRLVAQAPAGQVSASMMFATARFNAFAAQAQGLPPGEVDEETVRYFVGEYETMLRENLAQVLSARQVKGL